MKTIKKIAYLGPEGTFTEEALLVYIDKLKKNTYTGCRYRGY